MNGWTVVGGAGQALFTLRFLLQWWQSEKAGRTVVSASFWWSSLIGTLALILYANHKGQWLMLAGALLNSSVYARNLVLLKDRSSKRGLSTLQATVLALIAISIIGAAVIFEFHTKEDPSPVWIAVGTLGQILWSGRFIVQWWLSERARESQLPALFWWFSLAGNSLLLPYSIHLGDWIFILGFAPGLLVQVRNLMLGRNKGEAEAS
jgi:lipid-A-disaccharide synthase-like uncharacterized protein